MRRRSFLGAAGAGVTASALVRSATAQTRTEWRMVTSWPKDMPGLGTGAERFARRVGEMSGGRLVIRVHPAGELVAPLQGFDAVANGTAEMSHGIAYHHTEKSKAFAFFAAVPFGLTAEEHVAWLRHGGGQRLWDELAEPFGVKPILCGGTGARMAGWFRKEIKKVDDLKGLKIRSAGFGAQVFEKLGAKSVRVPVGEIADAFQAKAIDAADGFGPAADLGLELHKSARFYYWPGVHEPSVAVELLVSKAKFDALAPDLRAILDAAAAAENAEILAELAFRAGPALQTLTGQNGTQLRQMPREVLIAQGNASGQLMRELAEDADPQVRKVAQVYLAQRRDLIAWTRTADQGFATARELKYAYP
ncbi:MAG: TRAP transporter substrate-binding protein [Alphaproteobacteria bacterium]|nr:TRAP transporter substrate-binding protein [Alphaproteobacteria bacterium]